MASLVDQTILVVGASSGIGAQVAREIAGHGNRVVLVARRTAELEAVAAEVRAAGSACLPITADALDPQAAAAVVARTVAEFGGVDVALLNAGQGPDMAIAEVGVDDIARVMALNYDVTVNYLVPLVAQMRRQRDGLIAQTNSLAGLMGIPRQGPYSAAKAAVRMLIDAARIELVPDGVRFTSIYPGFVATARVNADGLPKPFQISEEAAARHVLSALRREPANMSFPWRMSALVRLLRALPAPVSGAVLRKLAA
jgi:short-subunit dehydrogenase